MNPSSRELRADCSACCGLCCVAPAFDALQGFAYDKPAQRPCRHLDASDRCLIHADRAPRGFPACAGFDCFGAGQWVTRLHGGRSWRDCAARARAMFEAYRRFRVLHEILAGIALVLDRRAESDREDLRLLQLEVETACDLEATSPGSVAVARLRSEVFDRLRQVPQKV